MTGITALLAVFLAVLGLNTVADASQVLQDPLLAALVVASAVAFIREHVWREARGVAVVILSAALGGLLGLARHVALQVPLVESLVWGVGAGALASMGVDFLKSLLKAKTPGEDRGNDQGSDKAPGPADSTRGRL